MRRRPLTAIVAFLLLVPVAARAQYVNRSTEFDDFGFTQPRLPAARPAALAGCYTAMGNDVHALVYNPAGLSRIKRLEVALGSHGETLDTRVKFFDLPQTIDSRTVGLELAAIAVPLPVYRGSCVLGFGIYRSYSSYIDLAYGGPNPVRNTSDSFLLQQTGSLHTYNLGFGVDLARTLSAGVSAFVMDGTITSLRQWDYLVPVTPAVSEYFSDDVSIDVDGFGARVGIQILMHRLFSVGVCVTTPVLIKADGNGYTEITQHVENDIDRYRLIEAPIHTEYVIPFHADAGVTLYPIPGLAATFEMGYSDWTEASIERKRFRTGDLDTVFRRVIDVRGAVEWTTPFLPLRLRAGAGLKPHPMRYLQADRISNNRLDRVLSEEKRLTWGVGAGWLAGKSMTIDIAITGSNGERSIATLSDRRRLSRFILTAAYRM